MPTLLEIAGDLSGTIPGLPNIFARKYVNRALREVKREKLWSWNIGTGVIVCPQLVTSSGTCAVVQFSSFVQFDATAQAVLLPLLLANPPLTSRQFRIGAGPVYSLVGYDDSTGIGTLDRIYGEGDAPNTSYVIYKCYYGPPSLDGTTAELTTDFLRYLVINNPIQGYVIAGRRLNMRREELDRRDPLRGAQGQPYYVAAYRPSPIVGSQTTSPDYGQMISEFWPHPTFQMSLLAQYERLHVNLNPGDYLPHQCDSDLVTYKALEFGYRWALTNAGRIPELKGTDWRFSLAEVKGKYKENLVLAKRNDSEISPTILMPGSASQYNFLGPIDSNFYQSHGLAEL